MHKILCILKKQSYALFWFFLDEDPPPDPMLTIEESNTDHLCFCALSNPQAPNHMLHVSIWANRELLTWKNYTNMNTGCINIRDLMVNHNNRMICLRVTLTAFNINGCNRLTKVIIWNDRLRGTCKIIIDFMFC